MPHTLFISDLHLDGARPRIVRLFLDFLNGPACAADSLYILGDLFEMWVGDDDPAAALQPAIEGLARLSARGVPVYFIHGNRDFLIGSGFARRAGCRLLPEASVIDLYGERTLLMHGDRLCTDDKAYQRYRAVIRQPLVRRTLGALSLRLRLALSRKLRAGTRQAVAGKRPQIMDVNPHAVVAAMRSHGVRRLIHGHTHRPAVHALEIDGAPATRFVLGDWYEQGSVLRCSPDDWQLVSLGVAHGA